MFTLSALPATSRIQTTLLIVCTDSRLRAAASAYNRKGRIASNAAKAGCAYLWITIHIVSKSMGGGEQFLGFNPFQNGDTLAHRLANHRKALGMTQKEFARQIGVDPSTLARWERGEREPTGRLLDRVNSVIPIAW